MNISIIEELKRHIRNVETQRDIYRLLLVDEVQFNRGISRCEAEERVSMEVFRRLAVVV